jgi:M6 family metalloprotease-like protein
MHVFSRLLFGAGLIGLSTTALYGLEPPTPEQRAQYIREGTLAQRAAQAGRLGNHRMDARLVWDTRQKLEGARLRALGKTDAEIAAALSRTPPPVRQGGLAATGTPKTFVLLVDFPDAPHTGVQTASDVESKMFGDGNSASYPYESVRNYYQRASYNQLTINGTVLGWYTAQQNRGYYENLGSHTGNEALIKEALASFDAQGHDFSQYDNDGDGQIDSLFLKWTGPVGAWLSFWWAYRSSWYTEPSYRIDGKRLGYYVWSWIARPESGPYDPHVDIHETGHLLGLPDYYDYDDTIGPRGGVGGLDMMDANWGDHNCFSKFVLGWLTPTTIISGSQTLSLNPSGTSQDCVLIMPNVTAGDTFDEFFMAQYRQRNANNDPSSYPTDGLVIWHVDATLNASGTNYESDNSYTEHKLLRLMEADGLEDIETNAAYADAGDFYVLGKEFGSSTTPNSNDYSSNDTEVGVGGLGSAGATMTATFSVGSGGGGDLAPVIADIPDHAVDPGTSYSRTPSLTQGTSPITWTLQQGPSGMSISSTTGLVSWSNPQPASSSFTITIRATNSVGSDDETWVLSINEEQIIDCNGNDVADDQDIAAGTSKDCNGNSVPDECDLATNDSKDCNHNAVPDECETDCNGNNIPDDCDITDGTAKDCNDNSIPDTCDIQNGTSSDCNRNRVPDECEPDCNNNGKADGCDLADGTSKDCNGNGSLDDCEIASGTSADCDGNGIPDECEPDCNLNGRPDTCDLADGSAKDCNGNGILDECDLVRHTAEDCNGNAIPDECELSNGSAKDCNANRIPDECERDCNNNGVPDACDLSGGTSTDCNGNGIPDGCDIANGTLKDEDGNDVPDECEAILEVETVGEGEISRSPVKSRYVPGEMVELKAVPADGWRFVDWSGDTTAYSKVISVYMRPVTKLTATFENPSPIPISGGTYRAVVGATVQFDGSGCRDPLGEAVTLAWDFGDGTTGEGLAPAHAYAQTGYYIVILTVRDATGNAASTRLTAIISEPTPTPPDDDPNGSTDDTDSQTPSTPTAPASCFAIDNLTLAMFFAGLTFMRLRPRHA